jgi:transposase
MGRPAPPAVVYVFAEDRKGERATDQFAGFKGILQVDGRAGYNGRLDPPRPGGPVTFAFCFASFWRPRRNWITHRGRGTAPHWWVYAIEDRMRGKSADIRRSVRQAGTKRLLEYFKLWLDARLGEISQKSGLAEAIRPLRCALQCGRGPAEPRSGYALAPSIQPRRILILNVGAVWPWLSRRLVVTS